jgi:hypothetical protein
MGMSRRLKAGNKKYEHTKLLRQVKGVGPIPALAYVLTLENPERFAKSRDVGPYLGLVPKQEDSRGQPAATGNQQNRGRDAPQTAGGERALYFGTLRTRPRLTTLRAAALRARRKEREEASGSSGGAEAGGLAASALGEWRGL